MLDKLIKNYFSIKTAVDCLKLIFPILATYLITKYSVNRPRKIQIAELQFKNVYLPLYKIICIKNTKELSKDEIAKYSCRIKSITQKNYELTFPQLHELIDNLLQQLREDSGYLSTYNKISYQVSLDYEVLKRTLGYPSLKFFSIFVRMTKKDKLRTVIGWINLLYFCCLIFIPSIVIKNRPEALFFYLIGFMLLVFISIKINNMKD